MQKITRGKRQNSNINKDMIRVSKRLTDLTVADNYRFKKTMCKDCSKKDTCRVLPQICAKKGLKWK